MKRFEKDSDSSAKPPELQGEPAPEQKTERQWEETELVADETAAAYEEQNTGIQLTYILKEKEILYALIRTKYTGTRIFFSVIVAAVSVLLASLSLAKVRFSENPKFLPLLGIICAAFVFYVILDPFLRSKRRARLLADGRKIRMTIYPDHIAMGTGKKKWEIPLDGSEKRAVFHGLILLYIKEENNGLVILPLRCVNPAVLPDVQAMLFSGTTPRGT